MTSDGEGKGSVFCLQLPMRRASPTAVVFQSESLRVEGIRRHLNASRSPLGSHLSPPPSRRAHAEKSRREVGSRREALSGSRDGLQGALQCEVHNNGGLAGSISPGLLSQNLMSRHETLEGGGLAAAAGDSEALAGTGRNEEEKEDRDEAGQATGREDEGERERASTDEGGDNESRQVGARTTFSSLKPPSTRNISQASPGNTSPLASQKREILPQVSERPGQESIDRSGSEIAMCVSTPVSPSRVPYVDGHAVALSVTDALAGANVSAKSFINRGSVKANANRGSVKSNANKGSVKANLSAKGSVKSNIIKGSVKSIGNGPALDASWNILVVDDSALNRKMLTKLFKTVGQAVEEAVDGQDAVNKIKRRMNEGLPEYDAILMDFVMVRGWEKWFGVVWECAVCDVYVNLVLILLSLSSLAHSHCRSSSPSWMVPRPPAPSVPWVMLVASSA